MQLQLIKIKGKTYYHDPVKNRLRNIENPHDTREYFLKDKYTAMLARIVPEEETEEEI